MRRLQKTLCVFTAFILVFSVHSFAQTTEDLEQMVFRPSRLAKGFVFSFPGSFEVKNSKTRDGILLSGLLFKSDTARTKPGITTAGPDSAMPGYGKTKGLIFYLHGNTGNINECGKLAPVFTGLGYDFFVWDYRGYGKSGGKITSEQQFYSDAQDAYDNLKISYPENSIIIVGYSIGTGGAAMLAATNHPQKLILQAPYYSLADLTKNLYPSAPTEDLRYKFNVFEYLKKVKSPVFILHGDEDEVVYYGSSLKLKKYLKPATDSLITLKGQGHGGYDQDNADYMAALKSIL
jgi:pimeloyl-ACP methyl ester carboxylesterase